MANADVIALSRNAAASMVQRHERISGSRMVAYENVASMAGVSASWLRKFIKRSPDAKPSLTAGFNILALYDKTTAMSFYDRLCARVETEIAKEQAAIAELRDELNAATPASVEMAFAQASSKVDGEDE